MEKTRDVQNCLDGNFHLQPHIAGRTVWPIVWPIALPLHTTLWTLPVKGSRESNEGNDKTARGGQEMRMRMRMGQRERWFENLVM